jgi:anti-anti-sigma regulatory factor
MNLTVEHDITIYEAEALQTLFSEFLLKADDVITLDMSNVEKIDMVGIQLLLSLTISVKNSNKKIQFINISEEILHEIKTSNTHISLAIETNAND